MSHLDVSYATETAAWNMSTRSVTDGPVTVAQHQNQEEIHFETRSKDGLSWFRSYQVFKRQNSYAPAPSPDHWLKLCPCL